MPRVTNLKSPPPIDVEKSLRTMLFRSEIASDKPVAVEKLADWQEF